MIIEQIPGEVEINDVTDNLKEGYWPSYNVPYSKDFFKKSGYENIIKQYINNKLQYDYESCSRARIFKRDQNKVKTSNDFKKIMRYNNYKFDNLSNGIPSLSLACRYDLIGGNYSACFGATDVKFVSVKELLEGKSYAHIISGPTNDQQPTFSWSNTTCNISSPDRWYTKGLIDTWNFDWVDQKSKLFEFKKKEDDGDDDNTLLVICLCIGSVLILIIISVIVWLIRSKFKSNNLNEKINQISFADDDKDKIDTKGDSLI